MHSNLRKHIQKDRHTKVNVTKCCFFTDITHKGNVQVTPIPTLSLWQPIPRDIFGPIYDYYAGYRLCGGRIGKVKNHKP